jgi:hypothetical protein
VQADSPCSLAHGEHRLPWAVGRGPWAVGRGPWVATMLRAVPRAFDAGGTLCTQIVVFNSSRLTCSVPPQPVGAYPLVVSLNGVNSSASYVPVYRLCAGGRFGLPGQDCEACPAVWRGLLPGDVQAWCSPPPHATHDAFCRMYAVCAMHDHAAVAFRSMETPPQTCLHVLLVCACVPKKGNGTLTCCDCIAVRGGAAWYVGRQRLAASLGH